MGSSGLAASLERNLPINQRVSGTARQKLREIDADLKWALMSFCVRECASRCKHKPLTTKCKETPGFRNNFLYGLIKCSATLHWLTVQFQSTPQKVQTKSRLVIVVMSIRLDSGRKWVLSHATKSAYKVHMNELSRSDILTIEWLYMHQCHSVHSLLLHIKGHFDYH